jgi:hypothetical protein
MRCPSRPHRKVLQDSHVQFNYRLSESLRQASNETARVYAVAAGRLAPPIASALAQLRRIAAAEVRVYAGSHDRVMSLLQALQMQHVAGDTGDSRPARLVVIGCRHRADIRTVAAIRAALDAGAVVLSADRSAGLPILRDVLHPAAPLAGRWARLSPVVVSDSVGSQRRGLPPSIWLAAGHLPVQPITGTVTLAQDALSGEPIVVLVRRFNGWILHSVAHWWQDDSSRFTAVAQLPTGRAEGCDPDLSLSSGALSAATAMIEAMISGLLLAREMGWQGVEDVDCAEGEGYP